MTGSVTGKVTCNMPGRRRTSRGVSLIEAVVALAVMGFGMLGIAAMQSGLRQNSDIARQRAEAVRLASEAIEVMRAYSVVNATSGKVSFADIAATAGVPDADLNLPVTVNGINATFTRHVTVQDFPAQNRKTVEVLVTWLDRADRSSGSTQEVRLSTEIYRSPPELAGGLIVPNTPFLGSRHPTIPPQATLNSNGTSSFTPPGSPPGTVWTFNNANGWIIGACATPPCGFISARLLSGYISFATGASAPTSADAEAPASNALPNFAATPPSAGLVFVQARPLPPTPWTVQPPCFYETLPAAPALPQVVAYYCAISVIPMSSPPNAWSGRTVLNLGPATTLATSIADNSPGAYRVCRYTSRRDQSVVGTGTPVLGNWDHPLDYKYAIQNLVNQNFLVIRAGNGTTAFDCPDDDSGTPQVNGRTWHHQPDA